MTRFSLRGVGRLCAVFAASLLVLASAGGTMAWGGTTTWGVQTAGAESADGGLSGRLGAALSAAAPAAAAAAAADCPTLGDGDLVQGSGPDVYLYRDGILRALPDRETLRALGYDPNGVDPMRDECLRTLRIGEPLPSVGGGTPAGRSAASAAGPATARDPAAPTVLLQASDVQPASRATVRLWARTDAPDGAGLLLSIQRIDGDGRGASSGLVTSCPGMTSCMVDVWEDEATTWTYVATLYRCPAPGTCVAVQESDPVSVTWR